VEFSNDGGLSWQVLAMGDRETSVTVPTDALPGGTKCLVRVLASDGLSSSYAISQPFEVETHAPVAHITQPVELQAIRTGDQVPIYGFAYDVEDGLLTGSAMTWSIDKVGPIGTGADAILPDLPPGRYAVTLDVVDSEGRKASDSTNIIVISPKKQ
jgi:hypothetical protein